MNIAVILAGGVGSRVGADRPKQFIEILGKPILAYTVEKFNSHPEVDAIEIVCVESHLEYLREMVNEYNLDKVKWITKGGDTFQGSVKNGIANLKNKISDDDIVLVHFGASPFIESDIISDAIRVCAEKGNAISTTNFIYLSGIKDDDTKTTKYIDRDTICCMNTPHAFQYKFICDLYDEGERTGVINRVEPHTTTMMYELGKPIYFSKGTQTNIKITTKEDLDLFEGYVLLQQKRLKESSD
ncbi:MAG: IspD/TarI family cytidylyltransferase [Ruminococcus sp.]|nr:IspD/TarI family cytidylyltransferase [Ruminococcus sp.]